MAELDFRSPENSCSKCGSLFTLNPESGDFECAECATEKKTSSSPYYQNPQDLLNDQVHNIQAQLEAQLQQQLENDPEYQRVKGIKKFYSDLEKNTPKVFMTHILLALNILLFAVSIFKAGGVAFGGKDLLSLGANFGIQTMEGEQWRLVTCMFLHGGITHILMNMYGLFAVGPMIEKVFGNANYLLIYFFTGIIASLASIDNKQDVLSVGASGAICGIYGAFLGFIFLQRKKIPPEISSSIWKNTVFVIVIAVILGVAMPNIDHAAHLGGLLSGILAAVIINVDISNVTPGNRLKKLISFLIIGSIIIFFYENHVSKKVSDFIGGRKVLESRVNSAVSALNNFEKQEEGRLAELSKSVGLSKEKFPEIAREIKEEFIPAWNSESNKLLKILEENRKVVISHYLEYFKKYKSLKSERLSQFQLFFETGNEDFLNKAKQLTEEFKKLKPEQFKKK